MDDNPFLSNQKLIKEFKLKTPNDRFIGKPKQKKKLSTIESNFFYNLTPSNGGESSVDLLRTPQSKRIRILATPPSTKNTRLNTNGRMISRTPDLVLDAPGVRNDYYSSVLDWSSRDDIVVALDKQCILWNRKNVSIQCETSTYINCTKFAPLGTSIGIGTEVEMSIQDIESKNVKYYHHEHGISTMLFKTEFEFVCGDSLGDLHFWDTRVAEHCTSIAGFHRDRVVGMCVKDTLLATGGNGNFINIWDERRRDKPMFTFKEHTSATRALAFCPFRDILASGGGLDDCTIKLFSTNTGNMVKSVSAGGQVCGLEWSLHYKELLSCQAATDQMTLFHFPSLVPFFNFQGHHSRTLDLAKSPDGQTIATLGDDETLKVF